LANNIGVVSLMVVYTQALKMESFLFLKEGAAEIAACGEENLSF
jgi:hypothetical protein